MNDYAIRLRRSDGPEVLQIEAVVPGEPGPGQARIRHTAVGFNFIDIHQRCGLYPLAFPCGLGLEAAGVIEALGPEVDDLATGDRVAYAGGPPGAYCSVRIMPTAPPVRLPDAPICSTWQPRCLPRCGTDTSASTFISAMRCTKWRSHIGRWRHVVPPDAACCCRDRAGAAQPFPQWSPR